LHFAICILQAQTIRCGFVLLMLVALATTTHAAELKWRSGRMAIKEESQPARSTAEQQFMRPRKPRNSDDWPAATESTTNTNRNSKKADAAKRFSDTKAHDSWPAADERARAKAAWKSESATKANSSFSATNTTTVDPAVMQAAFEEEGPQLTDDDESMAPLRSIIVDNDEELDFTRSAQLPSTDSDAAPNSQPNQTELDSQLQEDLLLPFGTPDGQQPGDVQATPFNGTQQLPQGTAPDTFPPSTTPGGTGDQALDDDLPVASPAQLEASREASDASCNDSLVKLRAKTIDTVNLSIAVSGTEGVHFPFECSLDSDQWHSGRSWEQTTFLWKASALCHKPLYFEDPQLERYGHSFPPCCQPLISGAHFFTRLPVLPYCMGVEPPMECIYSLGHYRPGSCAPYMFEPIPISYRGALFQAGAVVGAAAVLP
jgi:hypothetical protein